MISVLYVDDEPALLDIGKLFLEQTSGLSVDCVTSGKEALTRIASGNYDAVISDYQMPQMDGITLLKKVRETQKKLPFILFTGRGREEVVIEALNNGADFYLQKGGEPQSQFAELAHKIRIAVDRCRAESAVQKATGLLAATLESTADGMLVVDMTGTIIRHNQKFVDMWHIPEPVMAAGDDQATISAVLSQLINPKEFTDRIQHLYATPEASALDVIELKGGKVFERYTQPLKYGDLITGRAWSFRDVTRRVLVEMELRAANEEMTAAMEELVASEDELRRHIAEMAASEQKLRESEEKYRLIAENTADNIWIVDLDLNLKYISSSAQMMGGFSVEDVLSLPLGQAMSPGSLNNTTLRQLEDEIAQKVSGIDEPDRSVSFITEDKGPDGSTIFVENTISLIRDAERKPVGILGISRDISGRQRAENDLKETKLHLRSLVDNIQDPVIILDFSGTALYANRAAVTLVGITGTNSGELHSIAQYLDQPSREKAINDLAVIAQEGGPLTSEYRVMTASGETRVVEAVGIRITYQGKDADLVTLRDITERCTAQAALAEANRKLNLLAGITRHDVLNKLMVLSGSLILIKRQVTEPALVALVKKAEEASVAIRRQIEFTKTYENLGAGSPQWQDLQMVITRLPKILIPVDTGFPDVEIFADPMLELVFANLLDNTQRHGDDVHNVRVTVNESPDGLIISWTDDGIGVPADEKEKIFERGFGKNTGLGLFLVREILDITGITIRETGVPEHGARFEILVPKGKFRFLSG